MRVKEDISNLIGQKFGRWEILGEALLSEKPRYVLCKCKCGTIRPVILTTLKKGVSKSCGCLKNELQTKHGLSGNPLYYILASMKHRCYSKNGLDYKNYGGRGIRVCDEWLNNPKAFIDWAMQNGYEKGLTIVREINDGNYEPSNCRFVARKINNRNKRDNRLTDMDVVEIRNNKTLSNKDLSIKYKVSAKHISRIKVGKTRV